MAKSKVKSVSSKSKKAVKTSVKTIKKPSKELPPLPKKKSLKKVKPALPKAKPAKVPDLLPPPPPGYFKKKSEFSPSLRDIGKVVSSLRRDIHNIMDNEKVLFTPEERLMIWPEAKIVKIIDLLKDEDIYVKELADIEKKLTSYENLPKKGWFVDKKVKEASMLLQAYKQGAAEKRKKIIDHLTAIRKQKEEMDRESKKEQEQVEKKEVIKSLKQKKPKLSDIKPLEKIKLKVSERKGLFAFARKEAKPEKPKPKIPEPKQEVPEHVPKVSQHELRKHVFNLRDSIGHVIAHKGFFKKLDDKLHFLPHKELHGALDKLKKSKEHLDRIEHVEEHVAAHASVLHGKSTKSKLSIAKKLLGSHGLNLGKVKDNVVGKIKDVKKRITMLEKVHKKAKEEEVKLKEEHAAIMPKLSELKKHLKYVASNKNLLGIPEEKLNSLSSSKLYDISNKLSVLKQYFGEIENIEEHLVAESSKPKALTADKHLDDAQKLIDSFGIDLKEDKSKISKRIDLIKKLAKQAEKGIKPPKTVPELPKPKEMPELPKPEKVKVEKPEPEKPVELEVPKPEFEKPDPELAKLTKQLRKNLDFVLKNESIIQTSDDMLKSLSSWRLNRVTKKLNALKQCLDDIEHAEEHIAAEISMPKGLTAEKQIENAKTLIDSYGIDAAKKLKEVSAKLGSIEKESEKAPPPEIKEKPAKEPEEIEEIPELPKEHIEEPVKEIKPISDVPAAPPKIKIGVPSKGLAMQIYRLNKALDYVSKNEHPFRMSDEILRTLSSWRLKRIVKKLIKLEQHLDNVESIEEHIAAESSISKGAAVEKQLEKAKEVMDSYDLSPAKKLKEVKARIDFIGNLRPGLIPIKEIKVEKVKVEVPAEKEIPKVKPELAKPEVPLPDIRKIKPELAKLIPELKKNINLVTKYESILQIPDDTLTTLSSWRAGRTTRKLSLVKGALDKLEDIEEHIAAESSISQGPAIEANLDNMRKMVESVDTAKKLKIVDGKLDLMQVKLPEKVPELEKPMEMPPIPEEKPIPQKEIPPPPAVKPAKKPEIPAPKPAPGVPGFKPSPAELYLIISRLKKDLDYVADHERFLHAPDEKVIALPQSKFDQIFEQLKSEEKYLDDLEKIEKKIENYEGIPDKGWFSTRRIDEARKLLEAYKSSNVSMTRKMLMSRLNLMRERKGEIMGEELEREKGITEAVAEHEEKLGEEAKTLKEVEAHVKLHEKQAGEELAVDLKSLKQIKKVKPAVEIHRHKVIKFSPPKLEKPILDKDMFEARKEITQAIGAVKTGQIMTGDRIAYIMTKIDEARKSLEDLDVETAKSIYVDVHGVYMGMKPLEQYKVFEALKDLYEDRKQAEKLVSS